MGTTNSANGSELWQYQPERTALGITDPTEPQTLNHTRSDGSLVQVTLPADTLSKPATLVLIGSGGPSAPSGFAMVGKTFSLYVIIDGVPQPGYIFPEGVQVEVRITYTEDHAQGTDEALTLMVWNPTTKRWEGETCGEVVRRPASNQLTVPLCHLSRFGHFTPVEQTFLPLVEQ